MTRVIGHLVEIGNIFTTGAIFARFAQFLFITTIYSSYEMRVRNLGGLHPAVVKL